VFRFALLVLLLAGCGAPKLVGLQPEYPPIKRGLRSPWGEFVEVDGLRPTLAWQAFPRPDHVQRDDALRRARDVRYEIRVWQTEGGLAGVRVYERIGIDGPAHTLTTDLRPGARYLWTVRAHFLLDGAAYITEWGLSSPNLRSHVVPNPSCFRFRTPAHEPDGADSPP